MFVPETFAGRLICLRSLFGSAGGLGSPSVFCELPTVNHLLQVQTEHGLTSSSTTVMYRCLYLCRHSTCFNKMIFLSSNLTFVKVSNVISSANYKQCKNHTSVPAYNWLIWLYSRVIVQSVKLHRLKSARLHLLSELTENDWLIDRSLQLWHTAHD